MDLCTYNINATIVVLEKEHPHTQKNFRNYQKCLFVALAVIFFVRARQERAQSTVGFFVRCLKTLRTQLLGKKKNSGRTDRK